MMRVLTLLAGAAAVAAPALYAGRLTGRWGRSGSLEAAAARVTQVRPELGDWRGRDAALDKRQLEVGGIESYLSRSYVNRATGAEVQVLLICGRPGAISVHTPDVCYAGAGYVQGGQTEKIKVGDDEFKLGKFAKAAPVPDPLRILWAWSPADGRWQAPDSPRQAFARGDALYKLYVIRRTGDDGPEADAAATGLLRALLPELKRCLAPTP
jgi:hypothetical protein